MPKTTFALALEQSTQDAVRDVARDVGAPIGDLADVLLRFALDRMPREAIRKWAGELPAKRTRSGSTGMTKNEGAFLAALAALSKRNEPWSARAFTLTEIADATGLHIRDVWRAGGALVARGRVAYVGSPAVDAWGRPAVSIWWDVDAPPLLGVDVFEGLTKVRSWLDGPQSYGDRTGALRMIETEIGLSDRARDALNKPLADEISESNLRANRPSWRAEFRERFGRYFPVPEVWATPPKRLNHADGSWEMVRHDDSRLVKP